MKILNVEISKGTIRRKKVYGAGGIVIIFESNDNLPIDGVVTITFEDQAKFFKINDSSITKNKELQFSATEYGYWGTKLSRDKSFDIRKLLGLKVEIVTDKEQLLHLDNASCLT